MYNNICHIKYIIPIRIYGADLELLIGIFKTMYYSTCMNTLIPCTHDIPHYYLKFNIGSWVIKYNYIHLLYSIYI